MVRKRLKKHKKVKFLCTLFAKKCHTPKWLFILLLVVLMLRIPSFFEPYSYGDEMIYLSLGEAIRRGVPLYKEIHDNKPPLLYITAAVAGSLFWFKAILTIWHLTTVFLFWKLSCVLFPRKANFQKVATLIFALLTTLPLLEGNIVNAELFMIGPMIAAFLILLSKKLSFKNIFAAGMLFSVATLFKVPAVFDIPAIVFLWLATNKLDKKNFKQIAVNTSCLALGFLAPIVLTIIWYYLRGAAGEYIIAAFLQNVGYLSTWRPADVQKSFLTRNAPLLFRAAVVGFGLLIMYWKRKKLSRQFIFITAWLLLSLFAVTLSERPYPHYLIQSVPSMSFLLAILFTHKTVEQALVIIPLTLAFFVPVYFKFWYYPTTPYYLRFIKFAGGALSRDEYLSSFGDDIVRNYKISDYIVSSTRKQDKVFVWGDSSVIYALSRRFPPGKYIANYHIRDFSSPEETMASFKPVMPKLIIILPGSPPFPELILFLRKNYILLDTIDGAQIWNVLSAGVRALIAS